MVELTHPTITRIYDEELPATTHEQLVGPPDAVDLLNVLLPHEEAREEDAPSAAPRVQMRCLQRVTELEARGECVVADE